MDAVHLRLLAHAEAIFGAAETDPQTPEQVAAASTRLGRTLPPGYQRFLEQVGKVYHPLHIENVVSFGAGTWPRSFVPFASNERGRLYGFDLRGPPGPELPIDCLDPDSDDLDETPMPARAFEDWLAERLDELAPPP